MPIFSLKKQTIVFGNKVDMFHHHMTVSTCRISLYKDKVYLDFAWQFASLNCFYCMFCVAGFCICPKRWSCFPCGQWISCTAVSCLGCRYLLFFRFYILLIVKTDLLTVQVVWSRWLDISLVLFWVFYSAIPTNKNAKKNWTDIQPSWLHTWSLTILSFLQMTARALPYLEEDERLLPKLTNLRFVLLTQCNAITLSGEFCFLVCDDNYWYFFVMMFLIFSRQYVGQDYTQKKSVGGKVTLDQIDGVSWHWILC